MAEGKWILELGPDTPIEEAARRVLKARLELVGETLPRAVCESERDPEYVHQLRVSTRRADAAVRVFEACLPRWLFRSSRRCLRLIRRAAGAARDWDVFQAELAAWINDRPAKEHAGIDFLLGFGLGQRTSAQTQLVASSQTVGDQLQSIEKAVREEVRVPPDAANENTLLAWAKRLMATHLQALEAAALKDLMDYDNLHQVRIAGKRLRYVMEIVDPCYQAPFRETIYAQVEEVQEILGRANDSHVASQRLFYLRERLKKMMPGSWKRYRLGIEALIRLHTRRLPKERQRFLQWWEAWSEANVANAISKLQIHS
jgi:CHAD domain-containing protein